MFLFKKIVSQFFFPMPVCLFFCFTGLALLWWTKKQKVGKVLVTTGLLLLTALSYEPVSNALLRPLESRYPCYVRGDSPPVDYVVVLGGGHTSDPRLPLSSQLSDESLKRLVEGIRIYRENPGSKLLLSGGNWLDPLPNAAVLAEVAKQLGVKSDDLVLESKSKDTADEARLIAPMVTNNRFVLVTSSCHLPRSMLLFERAGLKPEAAPAGNFAKSSLGPGLLFPNARSLRQAETAIYEFLGNVWIRMRSPSSS
jgi:uncharacterized SAM-binding protein YcdF (DUF218 family)